MNAFNPMQLAFVTDIHITNATEETIRVTPVGAYDEEGHRAPLQFFGQRRPAYESSQRGGFVVGPGETIELLYDWDDINLSEIVVERADGRVGQFVADAEPTMRQFHQPDPNHFTIRDLTALEPVGPEVLEAFREAQHAQKFRPGSLVWLTPWVTFGVLWWWWRRRGSWSLRTSSG
jgi:hypothetical protein